MEKRQLVLNDKPQLGGDCVLYVMSRDQRLHDNHALLMAQQSALESKLPLVLLCNLLPSVGVRRREQFEFMLTGLRELATEAEKLGIHFTLTHGDAADQIAQTIQSLKAKEVLFDFSPLHGPREMQKAVAAAAPCRVSVIDTHNIIPVWVTSDKEEFAAHTIRPKIHKQLADWLVEPPKVRKHPYRLKQAPPKPDRKFAERSIAKLPAAGSNYAFQSGEAAAQQALQTFIQDGLAGYGSTRNNPALDGQSDLSPYLHFGQLSALRIALEVTKKLDEPPLLLRQGKMASYPDSPHLIDDVNALLEELIIRKELADNFCLYNAHYKSLDGAKDWAKKSLAEHAGDPREFIYTRDEWERAETHDEAWNAAQIQMMRTGKMHGYMRMYWAKKLLEWSAAPAEAIETAVYLNDAYSLDGGDPNGYVGILWSIAGIHDRPWFDRPVYGKIRYMNAAGLARKFNLQAYVTRWRKDTNNS